MKYPILSKYCSQSSIFLATNMIEINSCILIILFFSSFSCNIALATDLKIQLKIAYFTWGSSHVHWRKKCFLWLRNGWWECRRQLKKQKLSYLVLVWASTLVEFHCFQKYFLLILKNKFCETISVSSSDGQNSKKNFPGFIFYCLISKFLVCISTNQSCKNALILRKTYCNLLVLLQVDF